jgi:TetR/AcrR family transcriptional regulator
MPGSRLRPRPRDADATRELLLDSATEIFAEDGFAGARVDEIADRAGVNKSLIYAYYGDKEGLYRAVLSSRLATPLSSIALATGSDPRRALEEAIRRYFRLLLEDRAFARLLAWDLLLTGARKRDALLEAAGPFLDAIADLARRAHQSGALAAGVEPGMFRTAVVSLAVGYSLQHPAMEADRPRTGSRSTDEQFVDYACRLLLDGVHGDARSTRVRRGR